MRTRAEVARDTMKCPHTRLEAKMSGVFAMTVLSEIFRLVVFSRILPSNVASAAFGAGTVSWIESTAIGSDLLSASIFGKLSASIATAQKRARLDLDERTHIARCTAR